MRQINPAGIALIMEFEGCKLEPYFCPAGVLTVGFGHTGNDVHAGLQITQRQAEDLLTKDLSRFERGVEDAVEVPLTDNQFSALVSFCFNLGMGALLKSTLLRLLNKAQYGEAAKEFERWNRASGRVLEGLTRRREAERKLFLKEDV